MTKQEQLRTILVAARLNGLIDHFPEEAELYRGYAIFTQTPIGWGIVTDGKRINRRSLTNGLDVLKIIVNINIAIWEQIP